MSDEELKEEQEPEESAEDVLDQGNEELNTEWLGEEEWGDEEIDEDEITEEEVPSYVDYGDGTCDEWATKKTADDFTKFSLAKKK